MTNPNVNAGKKIIGFYSIAPSQGKRTLSLAMAQLLAENGHRTLYVELDTKHPSVGTANQIHHVTRNVSNYLQATINENEYAIENYVLQINDLLNTEDRDLKRVFSEVPSNLDFLVLPKTFKESQLPNLLEGKGTPEQNAHDFIQKMLYSFRVAKYRYIVINLPNEIESVFGYEVIKEIDLIINPVTVSPSRLIENQQTINFLSKNIDLLEDKWTTVLNMTSPYLKEEDNSTLLETKYQIQYDPERQQNEMSLTIGSDHIKEKLEVLGHDLDLSVVITPKKRNIFWKKERV